MKFNINFSFCNDESSLICSFFIVNEHFLWYLIHGLSQLNFMEGFSLVESISIFCSYHITMHILIRNPGSTIEESHGCGEPTGCTETLASVCSLHGVVEVSVTQWKWLSEVWLDSEPWIRTKWIPCCSRPCTWPSLGILVWMWHWHCLLSVFVGHGFQGVICSWRHLSEVKTIMRLVDYCIKFLPASAIEAWSLIESIPGEAPATECRESATQFVVWLLAWHVALVAWIHMILVCMRLL